MSNLPSNGSRLAAQLAFVLTLIAAMAAVVFYLMSLNPDKSSRTVRIQVEASGGFSIITLQAGSISIPKSTTVTTPWRRTVQLPSGTEIYLTASNPSQTGKISCSLTLDDEAWKAETNSAPKDGVACAGIVP